MSFKTFRVAFRLIQCLLMKDLAHLMKNLCKKQFKHLFNYMKVDVYFVFAFGKSNVIHNFHGNNTIKIIFIDEGFGSLDEESLQKAIQALIQLQESGRLIGVISHVEDLKDIFPAMLQVTKTKDGHSK